VVDALVGLPERLALLLRHLPAVKFLPGTRGDDARWPHDVVLLPAGGSWRRSAAGGRDGGLRPRRVERLVNDSWSFFVFFSQDGIFTALALWRRLRWCVRERRLCH
jgi:hypothetical protein